MSIVVMESKPRKLRRLISSDKIVIMPNVWDGYSAKLVEKAGFEAALISGASLSESRWAKPDLGLMSLYENLDGARMIAANTNLVLMADGDTGYGNAMSVYNTIREFEMTGVAGVMIEDQVEPKRCGHLMGKELITTGEMVKKIEAALEARTNPDFVIKARTDAANTLGVDEAIKRLSSYADIGADLVFADALLSIEDIRRVAEEVNAPLAVNMGLGIRRRTTTPLITPKVLEKIGVKVVEYGRMTSAAAISGVSKALEAFKATIESEEAREYPELAVSFEELQDVIGYKTWIERGDKYRLN